MYDPAAWFSEYGLLYLAGINLLGLLLFCADKQRAKNGRWRIPEKTLFMAAFLGGGIGCLLGMYLFRHKTRKNAFRFGIPLITIVEYVFIVFCRSNLIDMFLK